MLKSLSHLLNLQQPMESDFTVLCQVLVAEEQLSLIATKPNLLQASLPTCHVYAQCEMQPWPLALKVCHTARRARVCGRHIRPSWYSGWCVLVAIFLNASHLWSVAPSITLSFCWIFFFVNGQTYEVLFTIFSLCQSLFFSNLK